MDVLTSECSSGCESGWTLYFEHSMDGEGEGGASLRDPSPFLGKKNKATTLFSKRVEDDEVDDEQEEEEEEDLSMVSDASSGPPHLHEEEEEDVNPYQCHEGYAIRERMEVESESKRKKKKMMVMAMGDQQCPSQLLDDTASSSPFINFFPTQNFMLTTNATPMESLLGYPHDYPIAHIEGSSAFEQHFGISQPSLSSHQFQNKSQCSARKNMSFR